MFECTSYGDELHKPLAPILNSSGLQYLEILCIHPKFMPLTTAPQQPKASEKRSKHLLKTFEPFTSLSKSDTLSSRLVKMEGNHQNEWVLVDDTTEAIAAAAIEQTRVVSAVEDRVFSQLVAWRAEWFQLITENLVRTDGGFDPFVQPRLETLEANITAFYGTIKAELTNVTAAVVMSADNRDRLAVCQMEQRHQARALRETLALALEFQVRDGTRYFQRVGLIASCRRLSFLFDTHMAVFELYTRPPFEWWW
ncbi:hypothetical protein S40293_11216 [Stachybotrys chartarum IBT 40293]|nr:hypothetical protein S40293_11216 [Stachybotrys chartarum IBT 40293]